MKNELGIRRQTLSGYIDLVELLLGQTVRLSEGLEYFVKTEVSQKARKLKGRSNFTNEDFSENVRAARRKLWDRASEARSRTSEAK